MKDPLTIRWWNLSQAFTNASLALENAHWPLAHFYDSKATLWDTEGPTLTFCNNRPPTILSELGLTPLQQDIRDIPCGLTDWRESASGAELLRRATGARTIHLSPAVWTRQADALGRILARDGAAVVPETQVPHGRIFYWNTRVGMRDIFLSVPELADFLIPSVVCHDTAQVRHTIERMRPGGLVVKSNFALGGFGSTQLGEHQSVQIDDASYDSAELGSLPGKKGFSWAWRGEPFVVERFVGAAESNISITVDARVLADRRIEIVGTSEQLLEQGFAYAGIVTPPLSLGPIISKLHNAVSILGNFLNERGYTGFYNVDFVVTAAGAAYLCDLNVRRSAPLDVHMILRRIRRRHNGQLCWLSLDVPTHLETGDGVAKALRQADLMFTQDSGAVPLNSPVFYDSHNEVAIVTMLILEKSREALEEVLNAVRRVCLTR